MSQRISILDLEFDPLTEPEILGRIERAVQVRRGQSYRYVKPYVTFFASARRDEQVRQAINEADLVIADGIGVQWAASYLYMSKHSLWQWVKSLLQNIQNSSWISSVIPERGSGVDTTHRLLVQAAQNGWRIGVLGGRDPKRIESSLTERYPLLQIGGVWRGFFSPKAEVKLVERIQTTKLDILFVALGHPKQELFMATHKSDHLARVLIGEGGTFDYDEMGGSIKRAPHWMRHTGLEWFWRVLMRPTDIRKSLMIIPFIWWVYLAGKSKKLR
ncbi:WecB/TagA/CpsF family glycosyltransferase [bacterium]|nr:WecB/TagA/CpsF family glycosyltransferase [bacterium]